MGITIPSNGMANMSEQKVKRHYHLYTAPDPDIRNDRAPRALFRMGSYASRTNANRAKKLYGGKSIVIQCEHGLCAPKKA